MTSQRDRMLFWSLLLVQAACSQLLLWYGVPFYQRMHEGGPGATLTDFTPAVVAVAIMQVAYWTSRAPQRRMQVRGNAVLGHVLVWIGELSLFFSAALATYLLFDRGGGPAFAFWKLLILAAILFAVCCYKRQLTGLGDAMINADEGAAERTQPPSEATSGPTPRPASSPRDNRPHVPVRSPP